MFKTKFQSSKFLIPVAVILLFSFYVAGVFYPDTLWTTHFWSFIPSKVAFVSLTGLLGFLVVVQLGGIKRPKESFSFNNLFVLFISLVAGVLFYQFEITADYYGDAKNFNALLKSKMTVLPQNFWRDLLSIKIQTGHARWGVIHLYSLFSYYTGFSFALIFKLANVVFGVGFLFLYGRLVVKYLTDGWLQLCFFVVGISSPALLIFFGHIETYALAWFLLMSWLYVFISFFESGNLWRFIAVLFFLIVGIRFNTLFLLLIPVTFLGVLYHLDFTIKNLKAYFTLKNLFLFVLTPIWIIGVLLYFFYFKDYNDTRVLDGDVAAIDRLFLPLLSPEAPLDTYNLLSWNHIFDVLQMLLWWSPTVVFLVFTIIVYSKECSCNTTLINGLLVTILLFVSFLFMINPLMSLPMDWDLYCLPLPIVMVTLVLIFSRLQKEIPAFTTFLNVTGISLLCVPAFFVFFDTEMHSKRIESVGVRVFKTYYTHSDSYLLYALQMLEDPNLYQQRKANLIEKLRPHTSFTNNKAYANLLLDEGINFYAEKKYQKARNLFLSALRYYPEDNTTRKFLRNTNLMLYKHGFKTPAHHIASADSLATTGVSASRKFELHQKALKDLERAVFYDPVNPKISLFQMEVFFKLKQFDRALISAKELIRFKYPSPEESLRFGIHCALEAANYKEALSFCERYLTYHKDDAFIQSIKSDLKNNKNVTSLKSRFVQK